MKTGELSIDRGQHVFNIKHIDEVHNTDFDLQNSLYHTCPHPVTAIIRFKYFSVSDWPKSQRYFIKPAFFTKFGRCLPKSLNIVLKKDTRRRGAVVLFCKQK